MPINATKGVLDLLKSDGERRVNALQDEKSRLLKSGGSPGSSAGGGAAVPLNDYLKSQGF